MLPLLCTRLTTPFYSPPEPIAHSQDGVGRTVTMDSLNRWYNSPEYQPLIALRKECTSELDMLF